MRLPALFVLILCLYGCGESLPPGAQRIVLDRNIHSTGATLYQVYYELEDTAAWEKIVAEADTTERNGNYLKLRSNRIWYEVTLDSNRLKASQPYPGWRRAFDSVSVEKSVVYTSGWERMIAEVPAADVLLGSDSVRIGIIHIKGRAFQWQHFDLDHPDYLILFPPGRDSFPIYLNQDNIGPVTNQTVIRVGRRHYAIRSISDDRREMVIEPVDDPGDIQLSAQVDLNYRQVSVNDLSGEQTYIKRQEGRELILMFAVPHPFTATMLGGLDSFYQAMPDARRENIQVEVVLQMTTPAAATIFLDTLDLSFPINLGNAKTCLRLNCQPSYPYYLSVNENGRITNFFGRPEELVGKFGPKNTVLKK